MGKHYQFPLRDEKYRCLKHGDVAALQREEKYRLLIHPCQEDPEEYFEYIYPKKRRNRLHQALQQVLQKNFYIK